LSAINLPTRKPIAHNADSHRVARGGALSQAAVVKWEYSGMLQVDSATSTVDRQSPLVVAAQRLVARIEGLVVEVDKLRADNAALRREVRDAVAMLDAAGNGARAGRAPRSRAEPATKAAARRRRRVRAVKGRATPAEVTSDVVRAVLVKLGEATATEIAAEITAAGAPVGGRAVRFLAERAGATTRVGKDGQRRYRFG